jgi:hypothetical protein
MLRSNKRDLHPLWFGVYENLVNHHGAGFRKPAMRTDEATGISYADTVARNTRLSIQVFARIKADPRYYRELFESSSGTRHASNRPQSPNVTW